jgi:hypothetical protein
VYVALALRNENERVAVSVSHAIQEGEPTTILEESDGSRIWSAPSTT